MNERAIKREPSMRPTPDARAQQPDLQAITGGRAARTEADQAARSTRFEEVITEAMDPMANLPQYYAETPTVPTDRPTKSLENSTLLTPLDGQSLENLSTAAINELSTQVSQREVITTTSGAEIFDQPKKADEIESISLELDDDDEEVQLMDADAPVQNTIFEAETVKLPTKDKAAAEMPTQALDQTWFDREVSEEILRQQGLLPETSAQTESRVIEAEARLSSALTRGWESVRQRLNRFFTDAQGQERKGRLVTTGTTLAALGTVAMMSLTAHMTEGFSMNVQKYIDSQPAPITLQEAINKLPKSEGTTTIKVDVSPKTYQATMGSVKKIH